MSIKYVMVWIGIGILAHSELEYSQLVHSNGFSFRISISILQIINLFLD